MYAGTTLTPLSGRLLGAHQKFNRLAYSHVQKLIGKPGAFPDIRTILHFEGANGPDAIKRKSPAKDEPWHYYSPFDSTDTGLLSLMQIHYDELVQALKNRDDIRAAFEAAWLAHGLVDGLTPAHHYPYEEKLTELRGGQEIEARTTYKEKLVMPGDTRRKQVHNNWKMWGSKGLLSTHFFFEWGVAALVAPFSASQVKIKPQDIEDLRTYGMIETFRRTAKEISALDMYTMYYKSGWTPYLAKQVRRHLVPAIVKMVALSWYSAAIDAGITEQQ